MPAEVLITVLVNLDIEGDDVTASSLVSVESPEDMPDVLLEGALASAADALVKSGLSDPLVERVVALWNQSDGWIPGAAYKDLAEALGVDISRLKHWDPELRTHVGGNS